MEWSDELSVKVKEIDEQHKELIEIINQAHKINMGEDKKKGNEILNKLIEFTRVHFTTEEKYFKKCKYPKSEEHIVEHVELIEKVLKFKRDYEIGKCNCEEFLGFLKDWLENHLKVMDMKYVDNFQKCGLK